MPSKIGKVALLGATGGTGQVVLRSLLNRGTANIQVYVRSKAKLERLFPGIGENPRVVIFVGPISDVSTVRDCLSGVDVSHISDAKSDTT